MITRKPTGTILFEIYLPAAQRVEILGDFTGWGHSPAAMQRRADGFWQAQLDLPAGEHRFRYRVDGWRWITDFAAHGVSLNDFGDWNSRLCVSPTPAIHALAA